MSAKKEKTSSYGTSNQTATTTPNTPDWLKQPWQGFTGQVNDLMNSGKPLVAGPSELQNQAFQGAANLAPSQNFDWATQLGLGAGMAGANTAQGVSAGPAAQAGSRSITDLDLNAYLNAGLGDQITATQADYDATGGRVRAAQAGQSAMNGGARNSNNAVMQAITEGELSRAANTGIANVRANAYDQAGNLATNDLNREASTNQFNAGQTNNMSQFNTGQTNAMSQFNAGQQDGALERMLQSAGLLTNIGQAQGADQRANIGLQAGLGEQQRDIANQGSEAARLAMLQQLLGGVPIDQFTGRTVTSDGTQYGKGSSTSVGGSLDDVGKLMAMFSDERLKREIQTEGYDAKGRRWVSWRYVWDQAVRHFGVIAQEVQKTDPQAVHIHPSGYLMVNYGAL